MARRNKKKYVKPDPKIVGDPNVSYEPTENIEGPGRMPANYGHGHEKWPDQYQFQCRYPYSAKQGEGRLFTHSLGELYAAKVFLEYLMGEKEPRWVGLNCFITASGIEVRCPASESKDEENSLELALNYEPTRAERSWRLPETTRNQITLLTRMWPDVEKLTPRGQAKVERGVAARRPEGDFVSVQDICEDLGLEPREGRAALRKAKIEKPNWGWSFVAGSDELAAARKAIAKGKR